MIEGLRSLEGDLTAGSVRYPFIAHPRTVMIQDTGLGTLPVGLTSGARVSGGTSGTHGLVERAAVIGGNTQVKVSIIGADGSSTFTPTETITVEGSAVTFTADVVTSLLLPAQTGIPAGFENDPRMGLGNVNSFTTNALLSATYYDPAVHESVEVEIWGWCLSLGTGTDAQGMMDHLGNQLHGFLAVNGGPLAPGSAPLFVLDKGLSLDVAAGASNRGTIFYRIGRTRFRR